MTWSAPRIAAIGSTTSAPDADTTTTSRPAAWCSSISATASAYTVGSIDSCSVSATIDDTSDTSHPATMRDSWARRRSVWSSSAPPSR